MVDLCILLFPTLALKSDLIEKNASLSQYLPMIKSTYYDIFQVNNKETRKAFFQEELVKILWIRFCQTPFMIKFILDLKTNKGPIYRLIVKDCIRINANYDILPDLV
jgi:hypothetical protein